MLYSTVMERHPTPSCPMLLAYYPNIQSVAKFVTLSVACCSVSKIGNYKSAAGRTMRQSPVIGWK